MTGDRSATSTRLGVLLGVVPLLAWSASACGNLTAGGFGEVSVGVSGDAESGAAPVTGPAASPAAAGPLARTSHALEGEIEVELSLHLVSETGGVIQLGVGDLEIEVELSGESETDAIDRQLIPVGRYPELRLTFSEIEVQVQGLVVDGIPVPTVSVEIDDPPLVVTRPIGLEVLEGDGVRLVVDLNAPTWVGLVNPLTLTVDAAAVAALIDVAVD
jgi:hypothetical protein